MQRPQQFLSLFFLLLIISLSTARISLADTSVGGAITTDTTWTLTNSPYLVTSSVTVGGTGSATATLTIEAGVVVKFASSSSLIISNGTSKGALVARGTAGSRITLTRSAASGNWGNITFNDGTIDSTTIIENADIQYTAGVVMSYASPTLKNSTLTNVVGYGLNLSFSNPVIDTVTIANNSTYGIYLSSSSPTISGGSLTNANASGYGIYGSGSPVISNYTVSIIDGAGRYGLFLNPVTSSFSLTNSTIGNSLYIGSIGITPTITGNTFTNCDNSPLHVGANLLAGVLTGNTLTGLTSAGKIEIVGEQVNQDVTWSKLTAPYWVTSGTVSVYKDATTAATLTIDPGVVVKFAAGAGLQIGNGTSKGALVAVGTAGNRITFTRSAASGNWGNINFNDGTVDATSVIENADIQYSGGILMTSASPTIRNSTLTGVVGYGFNLTSSNPLIDTVTVTNDGSYGINLSTSSPTISGGSLTNANVNGHGIYGSGSPIVSNYTISIVNGVAKYGLYLSTTASTLSVTNSSIGNGLYIGSTSVIPTITGNTFTNSDNSPPHAGANIIASILSNNTFTGLTGAGKIEIVGEQVSQNVTWTKLVAPYWVISGYVSVYKDTATASTLTIDPGVVIKFAAGSTVQIGNGTSKGALVARGTSVERITFTRSAVSGTWGGLTFNDGTVDATTIIENTDIQYSTGIVMNSASPTIKNSTLTNVTGYGLSLSSSNPVIDTVTISNTSTYGIYLYSSSPIITGGSLTNTSTTGYGIYGNGSPVISNYNISSANSTGIYGIYLSTTTSALTVTNSTISNGLYLGTVGITPTITGNTFSNTDNSPLHVGANIVEAITLGNTFTGLTSAGKIEIVGEQVNRDTTWSNLAAPYWVVSGTVSIYKDTSNAATLTIAPGTTVKFSSVSALQIGFGASKGSLIARGTSNNRITLTRSAASGTWPGITFNDGTVDATAYIEYTDIQYSNGITMSSASPTIKNATLTNVTGYGLNLTSSNPIIDTVTISNDSYYGIYLNTSSPIISGGSLTNTNASGQGIYGNGSPVISNYNVSIVNSAGKYGIYLSTSTSTLSVINSTIGNGLYLGTTGISPTITGNTFSNSDNSPLHAGANTIAAIISNNMFTGFTSAGKIEVIGEQINQDAVWSKQVAPYVIVSGTVSVYKDTVSPATFTINPGTIVKFASGAGLQIGNGTSKGALVARGTTAERITFTRSAASGNWGNITIQASATAAIEYTDIQYSSDIAIYSSSSIKNSTIKDIAGSSAVMLSSANPLLENVIITTNSTYGIYLTSSSPTITGGSLTNTNTTGYGIYGYGSPVISSYTVSIVNSAAKYGVYLSTTTSSFSLTNSAIANGLYLGSTGITPTITGNTFSNGDNAPPHAGANAIGSIMSENTFNGLTAAGKIEVFGDVINQNVLWKKFAAPYVVLGTVSVYKDAVSTATLTIEPGTTLKFVASASLQVGSGSSYKGLLVADGSLAPITFTSNQAAPAPGNWIGITLSGDAASASILKNVVIEYGGYGAGYTNANLSLVSSSPTIRNAIIRNSAGSGIYIGTSGNMPMVLTSEIYGNKWGVSATSSNPYVNNSKIYGNSTAGAWNTTPYMLVDARNVWWGNTTGPYHVTNTSGTGNSVSDGIAFNPWQGQTIVNPLVFSDVRVAPSTFNPIGDYASFTAALTSNADWSITISDSGNAVVKTFTGTGMFVNQQWSGDDNQSVKLSDGTYTYKIEALNPATSETAPPLQGSINISRQFPIAILTAPTDNAVFTGGSLINVTGTASDPSDFKNYIIDYGAGDNPTSWIVLKNATSQVQNGLLQAWDLTSATGGIYSLRLTVTDNAGHATSKMVRLRLLWVQDVTVSESYISPNNDGIKDSTIISATASYPVNWTLKIVNGAGSVVRTFEANGTCLSQTWDGRDSNNALVPDGAYTYKIDAVDPVSLVTAQQRTGTITVDTTAPLGLITSPTSNSLARNSVALIGTASDQNFQSFQVEYGPAAGNGPWTLITSSATPVSASTLATWITNDLSNMVLLQNDSYALHLIVADKAGNYSMTGIQLQADNLILSNISASSHILDTGNGQTITVNFTINAPANVTLNIVPEKLGSSGTPIYQTSQNCLSAGQYSFVWDGKNAAGQVVSDEAYLYILDASDGTRNEGYSPSALTGAGSVTCTQGSYFPRRNIPLTINFSVAQPERVTMNISWGLKNFKIMDAVPYVAGTYNFVWDGKDPSNITLDGGGVAFCSVIALLTENHLVTTGATPQVTSVTTDPYQAQFSFGQFTRIKYVISRQASVTVKLISPTGTSTTVLDGVVQAAGEHTLEWTGVDSSDETEKRSLLTEAGDYTVWVQANDLSSGALSVMRGSLNMGN